MSWRRFDTLFLRLFLLMWVTLVLSHVFAFVVAMPGAGVDRLSPSRLPTLPSLPPGNPFAGDATGQRAGVPGGSPGERPLGDRPPEGAPPGPPPSGGPGAGVPGDGTAPPPLPRSRLWLDYGLRMLVIALGAALGARWLAAPMRRLSRAAGALAQGFAKAGRPLPLDERRGTLEVREAARVFNHMATRLQEQFDARGLHMAALSHDLRTPLTRLRLRMERLPDAAAQAAAADIREMDEMIDMTLAVLREQRDDESARSVELSALLQAITDDLAEQGQDVSMAPAPALRAHAHPAALRRVVGNLVNNALRYGERARIALASAPDGRIEIVIDDDGPGIPAEQLELAFQPWVRLATQHARSGHGLGLAIARDLAERDGGRLTLHDRPEGGLRARLLLPAA